MKIVYIFIFLLSQSVAFGQNNSAPVSHEIFNKLLKNSVSESGWVNYAEIKKNEKELNKYLELLSENPPNSNWSTNQKLAFWINAYNAFTIKLILNHSAQKITSIKDIGDKIKIPFVNTPWDLKFIKIGGQEMDLNHIEHSIIRKQFNEPRIHFALVCAAKSCPPLRNEAYSAENLHLQLNSQASLFINDPSKNTIGKNEMEISKIFDWYGGDFKKPSVYEVILKYATTKPDKKGKVKYKSYDWALNGNLK